MQWPRLEIERAGRLGAEADGRAERRARRRGDAREREREESEPGRRAKHLATPGGEGRSGTGRGRVDVTTHFFAAARRRIEHDTCAAGGDEANVASREGEKTRRARCEPSNRKMRG